MTLNSPPLTRFITMLKTLNAATIAPHAISLPAFSPRYEYSYDFYITIFVNNDYFDEIRFKINSGSIDITPPSAMRPGMTTRCNPETNVEYRNCKKLGEEIRQVLTQVRKDVRQQIEQEAAPKTAVTCPYCGATTTPDVNGCCEYCGGAVRG